MKTYAVRSPKSRTSASSRTACECCCAVPSYQPCKTYHVSKECREAIAWNVKQLLKIFNMQTRSQPRRWGRIVASRSDKAAKRCLHCSMQGCHRKKRYVLYLAGSSGTGVTGWEYDGGRGEIDPSLFLRKWLIMLGLLGSEGDCIEGSIIAVDVGRVISTCDSSDLVSALVAWGKHEGKLSSHYKCVISRGNQVWVSFVSLAYTGNWKAYMRCRLRVYIRVSHWHILF